MANFTSNFMSDADFQVFLKNYDFAFDYANKKTNKLSFDENLDMAIATSLADVDDFKNSQAAVNLKARIDSYLQQPLNTANTCAFVSYCQKAYTPTETHYFGGVIGKAVALRNAVLLYIKDSPNIQLYCNVAEAIIANQMIPDNVFEIISKITNTTIKLTNTADGSVAFIGRNGQWDKVIDIYYTPGHYS